MPRAVAAFVVATALGAGLGLLAKNGVLLGRDASGPVRSGAGGLGLPSAPLVSSERAVLVYQPVTLDGGAVDVEEVVPEFSSPGLEILGPLLAEEPEEMVIGDEGVWPPPGARPVETLRDGDMLAFGLRVAGPGIYRFSGFTFRYRRGIRRFDHGDSTAVCILQGGGEDACSTDDEPPAAARLAEVGGPADYGDGSELDDSFGNEEMQIRAGRGEPVTLRLPIVNGSDDAARIERLTLPAPGELVAPVEIPPHEMRHIEIRIRETCRQTDGFSNFDSLDAVVDGEQARIMLSTPIALEHHCVLRPR